MIINFNKNVKELENQNKWNQVFELLNTEWEKDKVNINSFLCFGTELWFILEFYEQLEISIDKSMLYQKLIEIKNYGFEKFENQIYFNAIFGYMIYIVPYLFLEYGTDAAYNEWKNKGKDMMRKAYKEEKANPFLVALNYLAIGDDEKFRESCKLLNIKNFFSEDEEVGRYFIRVFSTLY